MATRRLGRQRFDHGAQYFSAVSPRFRRQVNEWRQAGVVDEWFRLGGAARYRAAGGMNAIAKHMAAGLDLHVSTQVTRLLFEHNQWRVETLNGAEYRASALLLTAPVPQILELLSPLGIEISPRLHAVRYDPCFALMVALDGPAALPEVGWARPDGGPLGWIADNAAKGITEGPSALTLHATPEFSRAHFDAPADHVAALLLEAATPWFGDARVAESQLHRWRYSLVAEPGPEPCCVLRAPAPLVLAGDAFGGPRVEGAYLSGYAAAPALLGES